MNVGDSVDLQAAFRRGFFIARRGCVRPQTPLGLADVVGTRSRESGQTGSEEASCESVAGHAELHSVLKLGSVSHGWRGVRREKLLRRGVRGVRG